LGSLLAEVKSSLLVSKGNCVEKSRTFFFVKPVDVNIVTQEISAKFYVIGSDSFMKKTVAINELNKILGVCLFSRFLIDMSLFENLL
jgi:hypothetical protein